MDQADELHECEAELAELLESELDDQLHDYLEIVMELVITRILSRGLELTPAAPQIRIVRRPNFSMVQKETGVETTLMMVVTIKMRK